MYDSMYESDLGRSKWSHQDLYSQADTKGVYQGQEYTVPPKAMIIEAILKEVYGGQERHVTAPEYVLPDNLKNFYSAMGSKKQECLSWLQVLKVNMIARVVFSNPGFITFICF